jgi:hypothetical protein
MANYVHIENNTILEYHDKIPKNWKNISGLDLMTPEQRLSLGWYPVTNLSDAHNSDTHYIAGYTYDIFADHVVQTPQIVAYTEEEVETRRIQRNEEVLRQLRAQRNTLLAESDWTQVLDVSELYEPEWVTAWKTYRQQLRDLPESYETTELEDLQSVAWPTPPQS